MRAFLVLYPAHVLSVMLGFSAAVMITGFGFWASILLCASWALFAGARIYHAFYPERLIYQGAKGTVSEKMSHKAFSLPYLLQEARKEDNVMREAAPYNLYQKSGFIIFCFLLGAMCMVLGGLSMRSEPGFGPCFVTFITMAASFGILLTSVNVQGRLRWISGAGVFTMCVLTLCSILSHGAIAASHETGSGSADFYIWGALILIIIPAFLSLLKFWFKFQDQVAGYGLFIFALSLLCFYLSAGTSFQYPVILMAFVALLSAWLNVLHRWRKSYHAYLI